MRKLLLATAATVAIATPAAARDNAMYVGLDGGVMWVGDMDVDSIVEYTDTTIPNVILNNVAEVDYNMGYDIAGVVGYDFGMFRLEGELGYKRATADNLELSAPFLAAINDESGLTLTNDDLDIDGHVSSLSGMLNGLVDFGDPAGVNFTIGAGIGRAKVKAFGDSDSAWAYQLLAGVYMPLGTNVDVGLKYRWFRTGNLDFRDSYTFASSGAGFSGGTAFIDIDDKFTSHSLLASLVFSLGAAEALPPPPPPPPPAPAAPATQTCPDGSVILATDSCPLPPPPPPPPAAPVERGERGQ